jgi:hypothetical protein
LLGERILADITEAELIEPAAGKLMQPVHHMIVANFELLIDAGCIRDRQFECPLKIVSS